MSNGVRRKPVGLRRYQQRGEQDDGWSTVLTEAGAQVEGLWGQEGPPDLIATAGCALWKTEVETSGPLTAKALRCWSPHA